jgi:hypothetical protein
MLHFLFISSFRFQRARCRSTGIVAAVYPHVFRRCSPQVHFISIRFFQFIFSCVQQVNRIIIFCTPDFVSTSCDSLRRRKTNFDSISAQELSFWGLACKRAVS